MGRIALLLVALLSLAGCDQRALFDKFIPKEEAEFAKNYLSLFQARDFDGIEAALNPDLKNPQVLSKLEQVANFFPSETPKDVKIVGSNINVIDDRWHGSLTFQYEYSNKWLLANVVLHKAGNKLIVDGVNVQPMSDSLENANRFTFKGKGVSNYLVLAFSILVPALIIFTLLLCIKTPIAKRKWLWVIFILIGFVQITVDWTTGGFKINPFSFQLLGAGFFKAGPYGNLFISTSIPLGALVFLLTRKKLIEQSLSNTQA